MGLPGGRLDPADPDLLTTAIRETTEEVGCDLGRNELLGTLDDVWPRSPLPRLIVVRPYVFAKPRRPPLALSDEVAEAYWIPIAAFQSAGTHRDTQIRVRGQEMTFPAYHLEPGVVWGLTERILTSLFSLTM